MEKEESNYAYRCLPHKEMSFLQTGMVLLPMHSTQELKINLDGTWEAELSLGPRYLWRWILPPGFPGLGQTQQQWVQKPAETSPSTAPGHTNVEMFCIFSVPGLLIWSKSFPLGLHLLLSSLNTRSSQLPDQRYPCSHTQVPQNDLHTRDESEKKHRGYFTWLHWSMYSYLFVGNSWGKSESNLQIKVSLWIICSDQLFVLRHSLPFGLRKKIISTTSNKA